MEKALKPVRDCAVIYIDDILIYSNSWVEPLTHLRRVLSASRQASLVANQKKSKLGCSGVQYLRFNIGDGRVWPIQDKVTALEMAAPPST